MPELHDHVCGVLDPGVLVPVPQGPPLLSPTAVLGWSVEHLVLHEWRKESGHLAVRGCLGEVKGHVIKLS